MYTSINFKTKKALKEAVKEWNEHQTLKNAGPLTIGAVLASKQTQPKPVTVFQPGPFGGSEPSNGKVVLEGPHYPEPHWWYATAVLENGVIVKIS